MDEPSTGFDEERCLRLLRHYLPAQAPLKDFVHHNTLHAFEELKFHTALRTASGMFGYQVYLSVDEYRAAYRSGKIRQEVLERILLEKKGTEQLTHWMERLLNSPMEYSLEARCGALHDRWKEDCRVNLGKEVHPLIFRLIGAYLDQGISIWKYPGKNGFLNSVLEFEKDVPGGIFHSRRVRQLVQDQVPEIRTLLDILVGEESWYERYLFDQQFAHPGWSGMVARLELNPDGLFDPRPIKLRNFILIELLLEIDALDQKWGTDWPPLARQIRRVPEPLFADYPAHEYWEILSIWQEAFEWSFYDEALFGLCRAGVSEKKNEPGKPVYQAVFCLDDRSCSIRRNLETLEPSCETFGTAGFFNVAFYYQPEHSHFHSKACPAPVEPEILIRESESSFHHQKDAHFNRQAYGLIGGWLVSQTLGLWSAIKLAASIFRPTETAAMVSSFRHMDPNGILQIERAPDEEPDQGLRSGFTLDEMSERMAGLLSSIGMTKRFGDLVYLIGHGASSVNNTHYAGYDCGACSGRAGSVNARVAAMMLNKPEVRVELIHRGIRIPDQTWFVGGLMDTTRDEILFYDEGSIPAGLTTKHLSWKERVLHALDRNARERARRFESIDTRQNMEEIHAQVKRRALSLFEPRPEWNHATNAVCVIGPRKHNKHLFLDRRAFLNSYDCRLDPDARWLAVIIKAAVPVCTGINLEYFFSRVDNYRLGAGSKLPHNVIGLIGVANGMDGDLRPGLPMQMVNIHDPVRMLFTIEQYPDTVLRCVLGLDECYRVFLNEWAFLVVIHPDTREAWKFKDGQFERYTPLTQTLPSVSDLDTLLTSTAGNLPVMLVQND